MFPNNASLYGVRLLTPRPTPKMEDHNLLAVRDCLFNIFAAILHNGGPSSIHNLRTCRAVVTGSYLSRIWFTLMSAIRNMQELLTSKDLRRIRHTLPPTFSYELE